MSDMFFDMEQDEVERRIRKFRDPKSHVKFRLDQAAVLVDLVDRMIHASVEPEDEVDADAAVEPEDLEPATDGEGNPITADDVTPKTGGIVDAAKKLFGS